MLKFRKWGKEHLHHQTEESLNSGSGQTNLRGGFPASAPGLGADTCQDTMPWGCWSLVLMRGCSTLMPAAQWHAVGTAILQGKNLCSEKLRSKHNPYLLLCFSSCPFPRTQLWEHGCSRDALGDTKSNVSTMSFWVGSMLKNCVSTGAGRSSFFLRDVFGFQGLHDSSAHGFRKDVWGLPACTAACLPPAGTSASSD